MDCFDPKRTFAQSIGALTLLIPYVIEKGYTEEENLHGTDYNHPIRAGIEGRLSLRSITLAYKPAANAPYDF